MNSLLSSTLLILLVVFLYQSLNHVLGFIPCLLEDLSHKTEKTTIQVLLVILTTFIGTSKSVPLGVIAIMSSVILGSILTKHYIESSKGFQKTNAIHGLFSYIERLEKRKTVSPKKSFGGMKTS